MYLHAKDLRIIHAGIVVKHVAVVDRFYRDILGFHMYWHGRRTEGKDDWVMMQVPDGTDWIENMLNLPADADQRTLGVASHIALGVRDIRDTQGRLMDDGVKLTQQPVLGLDGKWQLNVYDPDETRIEFMEFRPKAKPCCSEFAGAQPGTE
jgi:catechol 2,3-dioxygenase-like lactoylglutathione lyase family enzyme